MSRTIDVSLYEEFSNLLCKLYNLESSVRDAIKTTNKSLALIKRDKEFAREHSKNEPMKVLLHRSFILENDIKYLNSVLKNVTIEYTNLHISVFNLNAPDNKMDSFVGDSYRDQLSSLHSAFNKSTEKIS